MDCIFDMSIRKLFPYFVEDLDTMNENLELLKTINGESLTFNTSWREVKHSLLPIMPTNRAHWMLRQLDIHIIKSVLYTFNSSNKTYRDSMAYEWVIPIVKILTLAESGWFVDENQ